MAQRVVYLDCHASTPCDPRVVEAMLPCFLEDYANPSSTAHVPGRHASDSLAAARQDVALAIGALEPEIAFTSGATESNNLAILGVARAAVAGRRKVLVSAVEHKCVLGAANALAREGFSVRVVPVDSEGLLDLDALVNELDDTVALVSVQAASNEIGTIQPVEEISQLVHRVGAVFHCDGAQALGRLPVDVGAWGVDYLSLSGHKVYGPKGIGALFVRGGARRSQLVPLMYGGGQEFELRPGTQNVPGAVGFGMAARLASENLQDEQQSIGRLRDALEAQLLATIPDVRRNGCLRRRLTGNSSLTFLGADAEAVIARLPDVAVSTGSACTSGAIEPSHVLTAIGLPRDESHQTLRIGVGRFTMPDDIAYAVGRLEQTVHTVRELESH